MNGLVMRKAFPCHNVIETWVRKLEKRIGVTLCKFSEAHKTKPNFELFRPQYALPNFNERRY